MGGAPGVAGADGVIEAGNLILAGFDEQAQQGQGVGERAQFGEGNAGVGARGVVEVDAERIVPLPAFDLRRRLRLQWLLRAEPTLWSHSGDGVARRGGEASDKVRGKDRSYGSVGKARSPVGSMAANVHDMF